MTIRRIDKNKHAHEIFYPLHMLSLTLNMHPQQSGGDRDVTLKAPITTAADDKFCDIFPSFRQKLGMIFHENCLPADNSHELSCLI